MINISRTPLTIAKIDEYFFIFVDFFYLLPRKLFKYLFWDQFNLLLSCNLLFVYFGVFRKRILFINK